MKYLHAISILVVYQDFDVKKHGFAKNFKIIPAFEKAYDTPFRMLSDGKNHLRKLAKCFRIKIDTRKRVELMSIKSRGNQDKIRIISAYLRQYTLIERCKILMIT